MTLFYRVIRQSGRACAWALASACLMLACSAAQAQMTGPEGRVYDVRTEQERYTAQFQPGGAYLDDRPRTGRWQFDGRTLCMLIAAAGPQAPEYEVCTPWRDLEIGESYESRYWTAQGGPAHITRIQ